MQITTLTVTLLIFYLLVFVCMHVHTRTHAVPQEPEEDRRADTPGGVRDACQGCWEPNLSPPEEQSFLSC